MGGSVEYKSWDITAPATDAAKRWHGWGTALKPAWEPIILARKPLTGTVAANVTQYGTGAINVDGCRIGTDAVVVNNYRNGGDCTSWSGTHAGQVYEQKIQQGRWPANVCLDEDAAGMLDAQAGERGAQGKASDILVRRFFKTDLLVNASCATLCTNIFIKLFISLLVSVCSLSTVLIARLHMVALGITTLPRCSTIITQSIVRRRGDDTVHRRIWYLPHSLNTITLNDFIFHLLRSLLCLAWCNHSAQCLDNEAVPADAFAVCHDAEKLYHVVR